MRALSIVVALWIVGSVVEAAPRERTAVFAVF
jgi:hypothetical protein